MPRAYISKTNAPVVARTYIKNNMNATATAKELRPYLAESSLESTGSRITSNSKVKKELNELLEEGGLSDENIDKLMTRNATQNRNIPASNSALDMAIKVKGKYSPEKKQTLNIDIKDPDQFIKTLLQEYERIKSLALPHNDAGQEQEGKTTQNTTT